MLGIVPPKRRQHKLLYSDVFCGDGFDGFSAFVLLLELEEEEDSLVSLLWPSR
jgi:hypothetical protein